MIEHPLNDGAFEKEAWNQAMLGYGFAAASFCLQTVGVLLFYKLGQNCADSWKLHYYKSLLNKPAKYYDTNDATSVSTQLEMFGANIEDAAGIKLSVFLMLAFWIIGALVIGLFYYAQMFFIWIVVIPILWLSIGIGYYISNKTIKERQNAYKDAASVSEETFEGIKTVTAFNMQENRKDLYLNKLTGDAEIVKKISLLQGLTWGFATAVLIALTGLSYYIMAKQIDDGDENWISGHNIQPDDFILFCIALYLGVQNAGFFGPLIEYISKGLSSVHTIQQISQQDEDQDESGTIKHDIKGNIKFHQVSFSYPSSPDINVLSEISFEIKKGQFVGIVGETGSGKSSIVQLIEKFYSPNGGQILLDGFDITNLDPKHLRKQIGYVSQEPILFARSIDENIRLGEIEFSQQEIRAACAKAQALSFIERHPEKFQRNVGSKGTGLSGGEKQRIVLARLFLHKYKMIILDEGTSALDLKTEKSVMHELLKTFTDTTVIAIAQRVSTVRQADNIIVVQNGQKTEEGNHKQLMDQDKFYAMMVKAQGQSKVYSQEGIALLNDAPVSTNVSQTSSTSQSFKASPIIILKWALGKVVSCWQLLLLAVLLGSIAGTCFPAAGLYSAKTLHAIMVSDHRVTRATHYMWFQFGIGIIDLVFFALLFYTTAIIGSSFAQSLRTKCIKNLVYSDPAFFEQNPPSVLSKKLGKDCMQASNLGGTVISMLLLSLTGLTVGLIIGAHYDKTMAFSFLAFIPAVVVSMIISEHYKQSSAQKNHKSETIVADSLTNIKTVKALQLENDFIYEFQDIQKQKNNGQKWYDLFKSGSIASFNSIIIAAMSTIIIIGANHVESDDLTRYGYTVALVTIMMSSWSYFVVAPIISDAVKGYHSVMNLSDIYAYKPEIDARQQNQFGEIESGRIQFSNVSFQFPQGSYKVLNNVSFNIPAGTSLGICGTTGSGKSTVVQLLLRFYDIQGGQITIDGIDIKQFDLKHLRNKIAWVGQEPLLFKGSFNYNIKFGKPEATEDEVVIAAKKAQADLFINEKSKKYESDVGYRGQQLSGGQKQRIGIARALIKDAPILVMDEASSALDSITEQNIQNEINDQKKTMIIVAHRLNTIQNCDRIMVMELGEVIEFGSHDDLIRHQGIYHSLLQLSGILN